MNESCFSKLRTEGYWAFLIIGDLFDAGPSNTRSNEIQAARIPPDSVNLNIKEI